MATSISPWVFSLSVFAGMLLMLEAGRRLALARKAEGKAGLSTLKGAIFGLTSLILAFSFSGAMSRYDARRLQILSEANAIGTAYLRLDLLPDDAQPALREMFRQYVDSRVAAYRALPVAAAALAEVKRAEAMQKVIWAAAVAASRRASPGTPTMLVIASLNEMFDISTSRTVAAMSHAPSIIFAMIFFLMLASALIAGQDMATPAARNLAHYLAYAVVLSATVFVILEIEFPRTGLIRLDSYDELLVDVRQGMR